MLGILWNAELEPLHFTQVCMWKTVFWSQKLHNACPFLYPFHWILIAFGTVFHSPSFSSPGSLSRRFNCCCVWLGTPPTLQVPLVKTKSRCVLLLVRAGEKKKKETFEKQCKLKREQESSQRGAASSREKVSPNQSRRLALGVSFIYLNFFLWVLCVGETKPPLLSFITESKVRLCMQCNRFSCVGPWPDACV